MTGAPRAPRAWLRHPGESDPFPGRVLTDHGWLADRRADTGRRWNSADPRVAVTLWWYSASAVLTSAGTAALLADLPVPDPRPDALTLTLRTEGHVGYLARTGTGRLLADAPHEAATGYGRALVEGLRPVVEALAVVGGANPRALWSILVDAIAGRLLTAARAATAVAAPCSQATPEGLTSLAARIVAGAPIPLPPRLARTGHDGAREGLGPVGAREGPGQGGVGGDLALTYVRRGSCCLLYLAPGQDRCTNCPRQTPVVRRRRVFAAAAP